MASVRAIASKSVILAPVDLWRMTPDGGECYRDEQDEPWLMLPMDFRPFGGLPGRGGTGKCSALSNRVM